MNSTIQAYNNVGATGIAKDANGRAEVPLADACRSFALSVKGVGGVPTAWSVLLEGSLDGVNWTTLITHNAGDGSTQWAVDKPVLHIRVNVSSLTLAPATGLNIIAVALP